VPGDAKDYHIGKGLARFDASKIVNFRWDVPYFFNTGCSRPLFLPSSLVTAPFSRVKSLGNNLAVNARSASDPDPHSKNR
jgi:hypothetical protein